MRIQRLITSNCHNNKTTKSTVELKAYFKHKVLDYREFLM